MSTAYQEQDLFNPVFQPGIEATPTVDLIPQDMAEAARNTYVRPKSLSNMGMIGEFIRDKVSIGLAEVVIDEPAIALEGVKARIESIQTDPSNIHSATMALLSKLALGHLYKKLEVIEGLPGAVAGRIAAEIDESGYSPQGWVLEPSPSESNGMVVARHRFVRI